MLAVSVIIKLPSRTPTDREEEKDETKLCAIWERRVLSIPAVWVSQRQMQRAGRTWGQKKEGAHRLLWRAALLTAQREGGARHHQSGQLWGLRATVQGETQGCRGKGK